MITPADRTERPTGSAPPKLARARRLALGAVAVLALPACASARAAPAQGPGAAPAPASAPAAAAIPADSGLFTVRHGGGKLLFEVPDSLFGREMLLVSRIAAVPANLGGFIPAGYKAHEQVVRFERRGEQVLLRKVAFEQVADDSLPIATSVVSNNFAPIIAALPVRPGGAEGGRVAVDVAALFEKDVPAISGLEPEQRNRFKVKRLDEARSFVNYARSFPLNVDVRHTLTFEAGEPPSNANTGTISMEMHHSLVLLPAVPMRPRHADPRVGYFSIERVNFGIPEQKAASERFIRRWRLEPSDPAAYARGEAVEPVKPIVYWLDPATPEEWRPCVKQGVEDWQKPFETAGFRNAILARQAPSPQEDPEWSAEDARHSVVRWAASLTRNAQGPSVSDPRSGEIIESDIVWYHNHLRSYRNRLLLETGAANPLARSLPVDRALMCEAMRAVIAHEVGHALGLPHNMASSSAYPVDSLRSAPFVRRMGIAPTIMDYARQNYIAQPGDGLVGTDFIRQIGPYDHHAINWGYRVIPGTPTAEAERPTLHRWVLERADDPVYRFHGGSRADPSVQTEDLGDDPVRASRYGMTNLKRVAPRLVEWTTREGEGYTDLEELYGELLGQWSRYAGHVVALVGGVSEHLKTADQAGAVYTPVPRARQEEAVRFLGTEVFDAPVWLADPGVVQRIGSEGAVARIGERQARIVDALLAPERLQRLVEAEAQAPGRGYPLAAFLADLKGAVWGAEPRGGDVYRRQLQRAYLERLRSLIVEEPRPGAPARGDAVALERSEIRPLVRAQLQELRRDAVRAARRSADAAERAHWEDVEARIDRILDAPKS